mmetsp:Transcript_4508/g.10911  ORF Transcript_4508/g.10911 Transcript_4508/m.10911 type:complete len:891 (-) Transcript_4508:32-2704(-)
MLPPGVQQLADKFLLNPKEALSGVSLRSLLQGRVLLTNAEVRPTALQEVLVPAFPLGLEVVRCTFDTALILLRVSAVTIEVQEATLELRSHDPFAEAADAAGSAGFWEEQVERMLNFRDKKSGKARKSRGVRIKAGLRVHFMALNVNITNVGREERVPLSIRMKFAQLAPLNPLTGKPAAHVGDAYRFDVDNLEDIVWNKIGIGQLEIFQAGSPRPVLEIGDLEIRRARKLPATKEHVATFAATAATQTTVGGVQLRGSEREVVAVLRSLRFCQLGMELAHGEGWDKLQSRVQGGHKHIGTNTELEVEGAFTNAVYEVNKQQRSQLKSSKVIAFGSNASRPSDAGLSDADSDSMEAVDKGEGETVYCSKGHLVTPAKRTYQLRSKRCEDCNHKLTRFSTRFSCTDCKLHLCKFCYRGRVQKASQSHVSDDPPGFTPFAPKKDSTGGSAGADKLLPHFREGAPLDVTLSASSRCALTHRGLEYLENNVMIGIVAELKTGKSGAVSIVVATNAGKRIRKPLAGCTPETLQQLRAMTAAMGMMDPSYRARPVQHIIGCRAERRVVKIKHLQFEITTDRGQRISLEMHHLDVSTDKCNALEEFQQQCFKDLFSDDLVDPPPADQFGELHTCATAQSCIVCFIEESTDWGVGTGGEPCPRRVQADDVIFSSSGTPLRLRKWGSANPMVINGKALTAIAVSATGVEVRVGEGFKQVRSAWKRFRAAMPSKPGRRDAMPKALVGVVLQQAMVESPQGVDGFRTRVQVDKMRVGSLHESDVAFTDLSDVDVWSSGENDVRAFDAKLGMNPALQRKWWEPLESLKAPPPKASRPTASGFSFASRKITSMARPWLSSSTEQKIRQFRLANQPTSCCSCFEWLRKIVSDFTAPRGPRTVEL